MGAQDTVVGLEQAVLQHLLRARRSVQLWVQKPDGWIWGVGVTAKPRGKL